MAAIISEKETAQATGRYLYAIIDGAADQQTFDCIGVEEERVYSIGDGDVSAVVSDLPNRRIRPERRRLAAHHGVLKSLMAEHSVLPMAFGLIAESPESVRRILKLNREAFERQLRQVRGTVEMGLRVTWDVANIFEHVVTVHPELQLLRDHIFREGRTPAQDEKIDLGRAFDQFLSADRQENQDRVIDALRPRCRDLAVNNPRNEREVMNLACLIGRDQQREFELAVIAVARLFDDSFAFDFNGPWPPHNFVEIDLKL